MIKLNERSSKWSFVDSSIGAVDAIQRLFTETSWRIAPMIIVLSPVIFMGAAVYHGAREALGDFVAFFMAASMAIGLDLLGMGSAKSTIRFLMALWDAELKEHVKIYKFFALVSGLGVVLYVVIAIVALILLEEMSQALRIIGIMLYILAPLSYAVNGMMNFANMVDQKHATEKEAEQLAAIAKIESDSAVAKAEQTRLESEAKEAADRAYQLEKEEREFTHQMALKAQELEHSLKLQKEADEARQKLERDQLAYQLRIAQEQTKQAQIQVQAIAPASSPAPAAPKRKNELTQEDWLFIAGSDWKAVMEKYGQAERTARRWVEDASKHLN
jgi:hypothetical protein